MEHQFDAIIIGAGLAGLRAAIEIGEDSSVAVISKVFATRSHSGAAQGGIGAALANEEDDNWEWHMFDTVKGSDYLGDQDAIETMTKDAPRTIYELEHLGCLLIEPVKGKLPRELSEGIPATLAKPRLKEPVSQPIAPAALFSTRSGNSVCSAILIFLMNITCYP